MLDLLKSTLQRQYKDSLPEMLTATEGGVTAGDAVVALFDLDKCWHRATVLKVIMADTTC